MTTGTMTTQGEALHTRIGINAFNNQVRRLKRPQTCIIPELFEAAERNDVLLAASSLGNGWILFPGPQIAKDLQWKEVPPSVLMLSRSATRQVQLEALAGINACFAGGAQ